MKRSVLFKVISILCILISICSLFVGCTQASNVNYNLNQAADNFEVFRKITVYNARTDLIVLEMEGLMSLSNNSTNELVVTCRTGENEYKKNYIYLNHFVIYVVEDISNTVTDPFHYKVHFYTAFPDVDFNH